VTLDDVRGRATIRLWPECAELIGVSKNTIYKLAADGTLPGVLTLGRKKLVAVPALLRWLGEREAPAGESGGHEIQADQITEVSRAR
jgi:excisionase family DNA binding protein